MSIRPVDLLAQIDSGHAPPILDVRSRGEYRAGHVPGAVHIPFWAAGSRALHLLHLGHLPPGASAAERTVVVYCGHGPRAWIAGAWLGLRGLRNLIFLEGHWAGWRREGLREEVGDGRSPTAN